MTGYFSLTHFQMWLPENGIFMIVNVTDTFLT